MNEQLVRQYYENLLKFANKEWTDQQWYKYCTVTLGQLMEENKDIFLQVKDKN